MLAFIFKRSFFSDRVAIMMTIGLALLLLINLSIFFLTLDSPNHPVAVRYSGYSTSLETENWQALYVLPFFSITSFLINVSLAVKIHASRRDIAIAVLVGGIFLLLLNIIVSRSLLSLI